MALRYTLSQDELDGHAQESMYGAAARERVAQASETERSEIAEQVREEIGNGVEEIYALDHAIADVLFDGDLSQLCVGQG